MKVPFLIFALCALANLATAQTQQPAPEKLFSYEIDPAKRDSFFLVEKVQDTAPTPENPRPTATFNSVLFRGPDTFWEFVESLKTQSDNLRKEAEKVDAMRVKIEAAADGHKAFLPKKKN